MLRRSWAAIGWTLPFAATLLVARVHADTIIVPPARPAPAGSDVQIQLLITNDSPRSQDFDIPAQLRTRVSAGMQAYNLTFERADGSDQRIALAPQLFRRIIYRARLPDDLVGDVTLRTLDPSIAPVMFSVSTGTAQASEAQAASAPAQSTETPAPAPLSREAAFLAAFSGYEPVYFAAGSRDGWNAKFQVSFKFRFFNEEAALAQRIHLLEHLYLGYTQTSLWELAAPSSPFRDTSYKPRLFYSNANSWHSREHPLRLGFEAGLGHESNGKSNAESRSINIAYVRPTLVIGSPGEWQWSLSPMIYRYLDKSDNPDIVDFRGYVDFYTSIGKADSWQLAGMFRKGTGEGWTTQLDLSYPLRSVALGNLNGYLQLQFFDGWGESILDYDRRFPAQYRIGLMFVR
ncbi:MAG TPA: phospholipase A [Burkholderiales bacterium]|nr:phospholipase A [Burkholderiales bacterium]